MALVVDPHGCANFSCPPFLDPRAADDVKAALMSDEQIAAICLVIGSMLGVGPGAVDKADADDRH